MSIEVIEAREFVQDSKCVWDEILISDLSGIIMKYLLPEDEDEYKIILSGRYRCACGKIAIFQRTDDFSYRCRDCVMFYPRSYLSNSIKITNIFGGIFNRLIILFQTILLPSR